MDAATLLRELSAIIDAAGSPEWAKSRVARVVEQMEREHELRRQEIHLNAAVKESVGHAQAKAKLDGVRFGGSVG